MFLRYPFTVYAWHGRRLGGVSPPKRMAVNAAGTLDGGLLFHRGSSVSWRRGANECRSIWRNPEGKTGVYL
jgi:hypothetical protein